MKKLRWIVFSVLGVFLLLVIVLAVMLATLDINRYKDDITQLVQQQTGRDLEIAGEIDLSFFPWLGFSVQSVSLSNAAGFKPETFAAVDTVNLKLKLLPLLKKEVELSAIELAGLSVDLQRRANGTTNWDDLMASQDSSQQASNKKTEETPAGSPLAALTIGGIAITNANIRWRDGVSGTDAALSQFDFSSEAITLGRPFAFSSHFSVSEKQSALEVDLDLKGRALVDLANARYILEDIQLSATARGEALPKEPLELRLTTSVDADLNQGEVSVDTLTLESLGMTLEGQVHVLDVLASPRVEGSVEITEFSPRRTLDLLGMAEVETTDPDALKQASTQLRFVATPEQVSVEPLTLQLDGSQLQGRISIEDLSRQSLRFDLALDHFDVDRYLPPTADTAQETEPDQATGDEALNLPLELLRSLDIKGAFSAGELKAMGLRVQALKLSLSADRGLIQVQPVTATLYQGSLRSGATLDARGAIPRFAVEAALMDIQAEPLLKDAVDMDLLSGVGEVSTDLETQGQSVSELMSQLNGTLQIRFKDGAIKGINLAQQARQVQDVLSGRRPEKSTEVPKTDFSSLAASAKITKGVMVNRDLDLRSPLLRVEGAGQVDLPREYVDYDAKVLITSDVRGQGGKSRKDLSGLRASIPIRGTFEELSTDITGAIQRAVKENLSDKIDEKIEKEREKLKEKLREEEKKAKEKLEREAEDQLKEQLGKELNKLLK
ncbi:MAG: AsmA family protein [Gammaproteobacteria bacterium]|nr:AsmA family protein [Gammaproteobacteria bacterium]